MANSSKGLELKVGIFVFIGLIILVIFVLMIGDFRLINPGYTFKVSFSFANGVKKSAPVRVSGVEMGEVRAIEFSYDVETKKPLVIIDVWVKKEANVPADSRVWVNMLGLLGEKYIEIIPGRDYEHLIGEGSLIIGEDPIAIQELTDLSREIAEQVGDTVSDVSVTLSKLNTTLDSINMILTNVEQGDGTIGKLFYDDSLYNNIEEMFGDLKKHPWKLLYRPKGQ
ncbi:MlaD family protein [Candidatus Omnitrophota bacterium]